MMSQAGETAQKLKTVAVVEPDAAVCSSLEFALAAEGLGVTVYANGQDVVDAVDLRPVACVVIEQKLPDTTGIDVVDRLRKRRISTPVILLVTAPEPELRRRAAQAGATVVEKPLIGNVLTDKLHELIG
jgi:FixJ family two-component response regulator